jgi:hypothetical protein
MRIRVVGAIGRASSRSNAESVCRTERHKHGDTKLLTTLGVSVDWLLYGDLKGLCRMTCARKAIPSAERPSSIQPKAEPDLQDIVDGYAQSLPHVQQIISDLLRNALAQQPPELAA